MRKGKETLQLNLWKIFVIPSQPGIRLMGVLGDVTQSMEAAPEISLSQHTTGPILGIESTTTGRIIIETERHRYELGQPRHTEQFRQLFTRCATLIAPPPKPLMFRGVTVGNRNHALPVGRNHQSSWPINFLPPRKELGEPASPVSGNHGMVWKHPEGIYLNDTSSQGTFMGPIIMRQTLAVKTDEVTLSGTLPGDLKGKTSKRSAQAAPPPSPMVEALERLDRPETENLARGELLAAIAILQLQPKDQSPGDEDWKGQVQVQWARLVKVPKDTPILLDDPLETCLVLGNPDNPEARLWWCAHFKETAESIVLVIDGCVVLPYVI